jgi:hypothetical protein
VPNHSAKGSTKLVSTGCLVTILVLLIVVGVIVIAVAGHFDFGDDLPVAR